MGIASLQKASKGKTLSQASKTFLFTTFSSNFLFQIYRKKGNTSTINLHIFFAWIHHLLAFYQFGFFSLSLSEPFENKLQAP